MSQKYLQCCLHFQMRSCIAMAEWGVVECDTNLHGQGCVRVG